MPTRFLLCRDDRFFPADFQRRVVRDRLGIDPDEMSGGHLPFLAQPDELVDWLEKYRAELGVWNRVRDCGRCWTTKHCRRIGVVIRRG